MIVGLTSQNGNTARLFINDEKGHQCKEVSEITPYLNEGKYIEVRAAKKPLTEQMRMTYGNSPLGADGLFIEPSELDALGLSEDLKKRIIRKVIGSKELCRNTFRYCLWINDNDLAEAMQYPRVAERINKVFLTRSESKDDSMQAYADRPHQMREMNIAKNSAIAVAQTSSENRAYLPCALIGNDTVVTNTAYAIYDAPIWNLALIASRLHLVWVKTVCGQLETRFRYSNTLGWHTFPIPKLTEKNKADLTQAAEKILEVRERHFPATIADLYDDMPDDLRSAHEWNDEVVERIFIGRKFKNDSERLEKLYEMYAKLTQKAESK